MIAQNPKIACPGDGIARSKSRKLVIRGGVARVWRRRIENHFDFRNFKTGRRQINIVIPQKFDLRR
jgi:hypothetical protein